MEEFDLNIEKILENWEPAHAVREIIANALDEQVLTGTRDIEIVKTGSVWHIRDYGRGLHYRHLTQKENEEKLRHERLIGKFGVGLKDALATFYRNGIFVEIRSRYGTITLTQTSKAGFADIITLHALVSTVERPDMVGTDVLLYRCPDEAILKAKMQFLRFTNAVVLEETRYGQVIRRDAPDPACIYINGVKVAKEPNFLFSYNITSMTKQLRNALNRERTNVGRSAYSDRVKAVLLACRSEDVIRPLVEDLHHYGTGTRHDELSWNDVMLYAAQQASRLEENAVFLSPKELERDPALVDEMKMEGHTTIVLPEIQLTRLTEYNRTARTDQKLMTGDEYTRMAWESFTPEYLDPSDLTPEERKVFQATDRILQLIGGKPHAVREIAIAKTLRQGNNVVVLGLWERLPGRVTVARSVLSSMKAYAGVLLHECAHALSLSSDVSRDFESTLTGMLGTLAAMLIEER